MVHATLAPQILRVPFLAKKGKLVMDITDENCRSPHSGTIGRGRWKCSAGLFAKLKAPFENGMFEHGLDANSRCLAGPSGMTSAAGSTLVPKSTSHFGRPNQQAPFGRDKFTSSVPNSRQIEVLGNPVTRDWPTAFLSFPLEVTERTILPSIQRRTNRPAIHKDALNIAFSRPTPPEQSNVNKVINADCRDYACSILQIPPVFGFCLNGSRALAGTSRLFLVLDDSPVAAVWANLVALACANRLRYAWTEPCRSKQPNRCPQPLGVACAVRLTGERDEAGFDRQIHRLG
jgi:hypothetical protein